jgi:hypothetical protein
VVATISPEFSSHAATERRMYDALRRQKLGGDGAADGEVTTPK